MNRLTFRHFFRWIVASIRTLGVNPENITINEGIDVIMCTLKCLPPRICNIFDFYAGLFSEKDVELLTKPAKKPLEAGLKINPHGNKIVEGVRSAEQFIMLAQAGYAVDKRGKK